MNTVLDKAANLLAESYAGPGAALPSDFINMLLSMALDLLKNCFAGGGLPAEMIQNARQKSRIARVMAERVVRQELRERHGLFGYARHDGEKIVAALLDAGGKATVQDLTELASIAG